MAVSPATAADALNFFNNWFVTGDYAVAGVGLRGTGSGGFATALLNSHRRLLSLGDVDPVTENLTPGLESVADLPEPPPIDEHDEV